MRLEHVHLDLNISGCWTEKKVLNEKDVLKLPAKDGLPVEVAAMLSVNPCTAYRMLKDFEHLQPGKGA